MPVQDTPSPMFPPAGVAQTVEESGMPPGTPHMHEEALDSEPVRQGVGLQAYRKIELPRDLSVASPTPTLARMRQRGLHSMTKRFRRFVVARASLLRLLSTLPTRCLRTPVRPPSAGLCLYRTFFAPLQRRICHRAAAVAVARRNGAWDAALVAGARRTASPGMECRRPLTGAARHPGLSSGFRTSLPFPLPDASSPPTLFPIGVLV
ncbi:hypothetical protein B0H63DRAFT_119504 [Podospora didyma]|uniref:Uncharacterized protein n=1 Tax=Podospora didyma TaxID=330526 RepID=A0AAE0NZF3_9PEZI|nr:hypothetical protein B0H63DRAFT_119504 [Podospora didyma]